MLVVFALHVYLIACWEIWWAGASFGHRMFVSMLPLLMLGGCNACRWWESSRRARTGSIAAVLLLALWNGGLVVQRLHEIGANLGRPVPEILEGLADFVPAFALQVASDIGIEL